MSKKILSLLLVLVMLVGVFASCVKPDNGNDGPGLGEGEGEGNQGSNNECEHTYTNDCDATCNKCNATREITHTYSNNCDTTCNVCNAERTVAPCADNDGDDKCDSCGANLACDHEWDGNCDDTCNKCEDVREAPHNYTANCDDTCNDCGATRPAAEHNDGAGDGFVDGVCGNCGIAMPFDIYTGVAGKDYTDPENYTSLDYIGGTTGLNWNPHTWETNDDSYVLGWLTTPLYDFVLNGDKTGYTIIPEAAAAMPKDVTADYVGQYGIVEGESAKAWLIKLNPLVKWDDGTPINAETYVYSMKQILDPLALNRRADSFYAGDFEVYNAKAYFYDGKISYSTVGGGLEDAYANGTTLYIDMWGFGELKGCKDADGNECPQYVDITDTVKYYDPNYDEWYSAADFYAGYFAPNAAYESYAPDYLYVSQSLPKVSWDEVGIEWVDEYSFVIVTANPVEEPDFYMPYNLSSNWIVHKDLYESCQTWYNAAGEEVEAGSADAVSITSNYCTTIETSISYGPYDLTTYQLDKQLTFTRNTTWFGYHDNKHLGQYQTDVISCEVVTEHKTALQMFLTGTLDGIGLDSTDMETYASSDRLLYTPESYTTKLTFNTDEDALKALGNNAHVLTIKEFREAFSLSIDREAFCAAYTASHLPGFGLLNYMYCYNPFTGELYRDSDAAKKALVDLYGIEYGEGKDYEDLEEAYNAITGYDPTKAIALMNVAAAKFTEAGWDGSEIVLDFRVYSEDEIYVKMFNFFDTSLKAVCAGTPFEGKIRLKMTADPDYYETMYSGNAAIIFSSWGGAAMSPFSMLAQCYCDASDGSGNQVEYGFDTNAIPVELTVDGKTVTASLKEWADWCNGSVVDKINSELGKFAEYEYPVRCEIFAQLEGIYLSYYTTAPLYYRNGASLVSRKIDYATTTYLQIIGYGGTRFMTFNYTDAEWDAVKGDITY